ncbi:MAG TPA: NlpC/P60 family protein [Acidimicrobiales bacterium]|nr:NlpC/P60 family protein [Acidimicrobiales bacterium]
MTTVPSTLDAAAPPIVQRVAAAQSAVQALGPELASDAASGNFAGMLSAIQSAIGQLNGQAAADAAATTSTTSSVQLGSLSGSTGSTGSTGGAGVGASATSATGGAVTGTSLVADAVQYLGVPYQWGGTSPSTGFDCSGLVQHVYGDLGISLPRTSQEQATMGQPVADLAAAQPGDLLFFEPGPSGPGHVGIYIGNGKMVDSPHTGTTVQVETVSTAPSAIRRIVATTPAGSGAGSASPASPVGVPSSLAPLFLSAGATYGVSPQLLAAVAKVESGFDPSATSSAGAEGLMQIMPGTAKGLGVDPYDPAQAVDGAARILAGNLQTFGSVPLALAAYNAGAGAVEQYGGIPPYPETQAYVTKIMGLLGGTGS